MSDVTRTLLQGLATGRIPKAIPADCEYGEELQMLIAYLQEVQRAALALSVGDLTAVQSSASGPVLGGLKAAQASLRHLTWQAQEIASGDFSQRVDFMGDFSRAFNRMVEQLAEAREGLVYTGTHDSLTGLYNRMFFEAEVERLCRGRIAPISVIMIDLDGLKRVNDTLGHAAGDEMIARAAHIIGPTFRVEDTVARLGGDEFAVLLPTVGSAVGKSVVERLARRTEAANSEEHQPRVSMSVGLATAEAGEGLRAALKLADQLMYADKASRRAGRTR
jgi:two-component system cell cycle response regulator